ncbi:hypothetical protein [Pararhizobium sp. O133]|uniref:hypothetical protein n=1 Tax=Pararhizobium sp. O133 TaxID=3449278 RepID=UPI003F682AD5
MPTTIPVPDDESPRGPQSTPGLPDRSQDKPAKPPVIDKGDNKNPNDPVLDPALLPIGDPAGMA